MAPLVRLDSFWPVKSLTGGAAWRGHVFCPQLYMADFHTDLFENTAGRFGSTLRCVTHVRQGIRRRLPHHSASVRGRTFERIRRYTLNYITFFLHFESHGGRIFHVGCRQARFCDGQRTPGRRPSSSPRFEGLCQCTYSTHHVYCHAYPFVFSLQGELLFFNAPLRTLHKRNFSLTPSWRDIAPTPWKPRRRLWTSILLW